MVGKVVVLGQEIGQKQVDSLVRNSCGIGLASVV